MSHKVKIVTEIEFSETELSDLLVTAFDGHHGACWYWARPYKANGGNAFEFSGEEWMSVTITEQEAHDESRKSYRVDHSVIVAGIEKLFAPGILPNRGDIREALLNHDMGQIDAEGADIIVQLGVFGVLIYG